MILVLVREAEADIERAFRWYAERGGILLARAFVDEVDASFAQALGAPRSLPVVYRGLRRVAVARFPYLAYFREHDEVVQVLGVLHVRRDRRRLGSRRSLP